METEDIPKMINPLAGATKVKKKKIKIYLYVSFFN